MSWNIRGLNGPIKQSGLKSVIMKYKIAVMGILETRIKVENWCELWRKFQLPQWNIAHNYSSSDHGRIWVLYDSTKANVNVIEEHAQFIHYRVIMDNDIFYWTCVYGSYDPSCRMELWRGLLRLGRNISEPRLIQGDFNAVCSNEDRMGGIQVNLEAAIEFQNWILELDLVEVQRSRPKYTW
ncbi:DNase I-like protein, partial [Dioscorea alata]